MPRHQSLDRDRLGQQLIPAQSPFIPPSRTLPAMADDPTPNQLQAAADSFRADYGAVREQIARVVVGQERIVEGVLIALFAGGHALLEGVPGIGKTLLVRTLAEALDLSFGRVQFTPDLMPADITGTTVVREIESEPGEGTTIRILFRRRAAELGGLGGRQGG